MPRYDDRYGGTRLYVGRLAPRTRSRDLEDIFSKYGRVRDVDMKRDFAFVEFSDPRDADDARYSLDGREVDGSRIAVEFARGAPRGPGGSREGGASRDRERGERGDRERERDREYLGRGPPPGSGRCFNCGLDGHWARDCKAGDWKNKCYRCGERGHIERNCKNSPKKLSGRGGRSYSRSPSPVRGRSRSRSYSRGRSYSRSRSPVKRKRNAEREESRSRSPMDSRRSPKRGRSSSPPPSKGRRQSLTPDDRSPQEKGNSPSPRAQVKANGSDYSGSRSPVPRAKSKSPSPEDRMIDENPTEENGNSQSPSPGVRDDRSPIDDGDNRGSPRGSESP